MADRTFERTDQVHGRRATERDGKDSAAAGNVASVYKVGIVSNWNANCGVAQYAMDLEAVLKKFFQVVRFTRMEEVTDVRVVLVNWHPATLTLQGVAVEQLKKQGVAVIVVLHNSNTGPLIVPLNDPLMLADAVVVHQKMEGTPKLVHIPFGIPVVDNLRAPGAEVYVGIAGFPYAWKRFNLVAEVARRLNGTAVLVAPKHQAGDTETPIQDIQRGYRNVMVLRDWLPEEEVVRTLSGCTLNVFWYQHMPPDDLQGQSGSVLLGVAAGRPLIVSKHPKLAHVAQYEDEVYVVETEEQVHQVAAEIVSRLRAGQPVKRPRRILREMGWDRAGARYLELIRQVVV